MDVRRWQDVLLECMRRINGSVAATCLVPGAEPGRYVGTYQGVCGPPGYTEAYSSYYHKIDVAAQHMLADIVCGPRVYPTSDYVIPRAAFESSEIYNDLVKPHSLIDFTSVSVGESAKDMFVVTIFGPRWSDGAALENASFLRMIQPHLARSIALFARIELAESSETIAKYALDRFRSGVIWLDRLGNVRWANASAEDLFQARDGIQIERRRLAGSRSSDTAAIEAAVGAVISGRPGSPVLVQRPSGLRPFVLNMVPIEHSAAGFAGPRASAVVFITDPEALPPPNVATLRALYGLTPSEASLAGALAAGRSPTEIARERGTTLLTVRTQIRSIKSKMGGASVPEIAREAASLSHIRP